MSGGAILDPISSIVTALALGASSALKDAAAQAIKDAYAGLKAILQRKYPNVSTTQLEQKPESESRRAVIAEDLKGTAAAQDSELLEKAKDLFDAVQRHAPYTAAAIGVDLEKVKGASLRISEILASGPGVRVRDAEIREDIEIRGVRAGARGELERPKG